MIDTTAPPHHLLSQMRLTINLDPELYALAKAIARKRDCSISVAVNELLRRGLEVRGPKRRLRYRGSLAIPVVAGTKPITSQDVDHEELRRPVVAY